jgi:hypothetical protein
MVLLQFMVFSTRFSSQNIPKMTSSKKPPYQFGQVDLDLVNAIG